MIRKVSYDIYYRHFNCSLCTGILTSPGMYLLSMADRAGANCRRSFKVKIKRKLIFTLNNHFKCLANRHIANAGYICRLL